MERFLRYAVEKNKKLRALWMEGGALVQKTVSVLGYDEQSVRFLVAGKKSETRVSREDLLSVGYARGDSGED